MTRHIFLHDPVPILRSLIALGICYFFIIISSPFALSRRIYRWAGEKGRERERGRRTLCSFNNFIFHFPALGPWPLALLVVSFFVFGHRSLWKFTPSTYRLRLLISMALLSVLLTWEESKVLERVAVFNCHLCGLMIDVPIIAKDQRWWII